MEMKRSTTSRRIKYGSNYLALACIVLGIIAVLNFFFLRHFSRIDLTQDKRYTLTPSTKEVLNSLDDLITIKLYFTEKLPPYLVALRRDITDILDEFHAYAGGNISITFVDPTDNPSLQQELRFMGIPQIQLNIIEKDQAQLTNVYLGMAIFYADKKEVIPFISSTGNLEYDLTAAIVKLTSKESKTIAIYSPSDPDLSKEYQSVKQLIERQYTLKPVNLEGGADTLKQASTLIVSGPRDLTDSQLYAIDQFLMRGGKIIFLVDAVDVKEGLQASPLKSSIQDLLAHYGVKVEENLVLDRSNANAAFRSGFMTFRIPYPFWVKVISDGFSRDNPAVSNLESLVLPWPSSLTVLDDKPSTVSIAELASSTPHAWLRKGFYSLDPQQQFLLPGMETDRHLLALAASGTFPSFFTGKPDPASDTKEGADAQDSSRQTINASPETKFILVGNSRFINNDIISQFRDNQIFLLNIIDWLTLGDKLIGIRSRAVTDRPLRETSENTRTLIKAVNMIGVPLLVILFGLIRFYLTRRRKRGATHNW